MGRNLSEDFKAKRARLSWQRNMLTVPLEDALYSCKFRMTSAGIVSFSCLNLESNKEQKWFLLMPIEKKGYIYGTLGPKIKIGIEAIPQKGKATAKLHSFIALKDGEKFVKFEAVPEMFWNRLNGTSLATKISKLQEGIDMFFFSGTPMILPPYDDEFREFVQTWDVLRDALDFTTQDNAIDFLFDMSNILSFANDD